MKFKNLYTASLLILSLSPACSRQMSSQGEENTKLRVLGYLASSGNWVAGLNAIDLSKITDLNLAFINPDSTGSFEANNDLNTVIQRAHEKNIRVFASIGGGNPPPFMDKLMTSARRTAFIAQIVALAQTYNFDGIDVDIENDLINSDYAPFVSQLAAAIKPANKLLTAALASWNGDIVHDSTIRNYDFINVMSYDKTGPWDTTRPGQHSPYSMTQNDFDYFHNKRHIAAAKLFLGVPFYGYGFGANAPSGLSYKQIIATYPGAENTDEVTVTGGGVIYYNGLATIKEKVRFAKNNKAGGVMIWQLLGDTTGPLSLLKAINDTK